MLLIPDSTASVAPIDDSRPAWASSCFESLSEMYACVGMPKYFPISLYAQSIICVSTAPIGVVSYRISNIEGEPP